jgi:protein-tyrosine kinase
MRSLFNRLKQWNRDSERSSPATPVAAKAVSKRISYLHTRRATVSHRHLEQNHVISALHQDAFTDAYKILRTQVLQRLRRNGMRTLAVTSPGPHEGKTLTAINLAISIATEINYTVLLVDADMRRPGVHTHLGLEARQGLRDYLRSDIPLSKLLVHPTGISGLVVLPSGKPHPRSAELLGSPKMTHLVKDLKTRYASRIVIFDLPPLLSTADALAFLPYVDATLLVLEEGKTRMQDARRAAGLLRQTNLIGTVINKSHVVEDTYYGYAHGD